MEKILFLIGSVLFTSLIVGSQGRRLVIQNEILESENSEVDFSGEIEDLCECSGSACSCCFELSNFKGCSIMQILEHKDVNGNSSYWVNLTISVNNHNVVSQIFSISDMEPLCYDLDALQACIQLYVKKTKRNLKICALLRLSLNENPISEQDLYCINVPKSTHTGYNSIIYNFLESDNIPLGSLVEKMVDSWTVQDIDVPAKQDEDHLDITQGNTGLAE